MNGTDARYYDRSDRRQRHVTPQKYGKILYTPKPRQFDYRPRYYDPEKEAREKRREELLGARPATEGEYVPGDMLRRRRMQRMMESEAGRRRGRRRTGSVLFLLVILAALVVAVVWVIS